MNSESSEVNISIAEQIKYIWASRYLVVSITSVFFLFFLIYALSQPSLYRAEVLLAPKADESGNSRLAAFASNLGGLASLTGIGSGSTNTTSMAIAIMKSRSFIGEFTEEEGITKQIFSDQWDSSTNQWTAPPKSFLQNSKDYLFGSQELAQDFEPSRMATINKFGKLVSINMDKDTGLYRLSVEWTDPVKSAEWANKLVLKINSYMKTKDIKESTKSIDYLSNEIAETSVATMKQVLYELIESQAQTMLLANVRDDYVFSVIDYAIAPEYRIKPKRTFIVIFGTSLGGVVGVFIALIRRSFVDKAVVKK